MKKKGSKILYLIAFVLLVSFALKFDLIAEPFSKMTGKPVETVKDIASLVFFVSLGLALIYFGVLSLVVPVVGGALILVGLGLVAVSCWKFFKTPTLSDAG